MYPRASAEIASARYLPDFPARWKTCFPHSLPSLFVLTKFLGCLLLLLLYVEGTVWWNDDSSNVLVWISDSVIHLFILRSSEGFGDFFS